MSVEFIYIDRARRIMVRIIQLGILTPLAIFFILGFPPKYGDRPTFLEEQFGFPEYWRIVSIGGLLLLFLIYIFLYSLLKTQSGKLKFLKEKLTITNHGKVVQEYPIKDLKDVKLEKDIPFKGDERYRSQRASKLHFNYNGRTIKLEFISQDPECFFKLNDYLKEVKLPDYKETYRPQPLIKWLDF